MTPRLTLRAAATPLLVAGALWGSTPLVSGVLADHGQTPPPCSPDGMCLPRPETYGWYQTRWRPFPGDAMGATPTPASDAKAQQQAEEEQFGGPQLPVPGEEGQVGPAKPGRRAGAPGAAAEAPGAAAEAPGEAAEAAPADQPPPGAEPGPGPGVEPGDQPPPVLDAPLRLDEPAAEDPLDPFSGNPPARSGQETSASQGPAPHADDAPPTLPASLQRISAGMQPTSGATQAPLDARHASPSLAQPPSVGAIGPRRLTQASAEAEVGIQLVNPAAAWVDRPIDQDFEHAIYYKASDMPTNAPPR